MTERGASPDEMLFYRIVPAIPASDFNLHLRGLRHKAAGRVRSVRGATRSMMTKSRFLKPVLKIGCAIVELFGHVVIIGRFDAFTAIEWNLLYR